MAVSPPRIKTLHFKGLLAKEAADSLYSYLKDNIKWEESIKAKAKGYTTSRLGKALDFEDDEKVDDTIAAVLQSLNLSYNLLLLSIYLNYYRNGGDMSPAHSHPKQCQIIISLGATRILTIGKKEYHLANGDVVVFGSSTHGIPLMPEVKEGRISIALFTIPIA